MAQILFSRIGRKVFYIFSLLVAIVIVFAVGIYLFAWDNIASRAFLQLVPLPAALVNNRFVTLEEVSTIEQGYERQVRSQIDFDFASPEGRSVLAKQRKQILQGLIENAIVEAELRKRSIETTMPEFEYYYTYVLTRIGLARDQAAQEIRNRYAWDEKKFKNFVVRPDLNRAKLQVAILQEQKDSDAFRKVTEVSDLLKSGQDFAVVAEVRSEDEASKFIGGSLGFVTSNELDPWLAKSAFGLKDGEISDIVISPAGYHILQVSSHYQEAGKEHVELRHILIKGEDVSNYLAKERKNYRIHSFGKF